MSKPTTYHRHENRAWPHPDDPACDIHYNAFPVAVVDVREGSEDMERWFGLLVEVMGIAYLNAAEVENLTETFRRFAAGESAEPEVITFQPGQRVRGKRSGVEFTVGRDGSYFNHALKWGRESGPAFTSEHYELVDGGDE